MRITIAVSFARLGERFARVTYLNLLVITLQVVCCERCQTAYLQQDINRKNPTA